MELFLFRPAEYERLYNCTGFDINQVPLERRQNYVESWINIGFCALYYVLYIPCMVSIWQHMNNSCYKILFVLNIPNLILLWQIGFLHGYLSIHGEMFCSHPTLLYITGCAALALWGWESVAEVILSINRCLAIISSPTEQMLFEGNKTWAWLTVPFVYSVWWFMFGKSAPFNAIYWTWLFNPFEGYRPDTEGNFLYHWHAAHDILLAFVIPAIYVVFLVAFVAKARSFQQPGSGSGLTLKQRLIFLQIVIISFLNLGACVVYIFMTYVYLSPTIIHFAQHFWFQIHGINPLIYLTLNQTIRNDSIRMVRRLLQKLHLAAPKEATAVGRVSTDHLTH